MIIIMIKYIATLVHLKSSIQREENYQIMIMELVQCHQLLIFLIITYQLRNLFKKLISILIQVKNWALYQMLKLRTSA